MASLIQDKSGNRSIQFVGPGRQRKTIRLGKLKLTKKDATTIKTKVEALNSAAITKTSWDSETAEWIGKLDTVLYDKLAAVELVPPRVESAKTSKATLGPFLGAYIVGRTDVKPGTKLVYEQTRRNLIGYFGADKPLGEITAGDADDWRLWLADTEALAPNTIRKRCAIAKLFLRAAIRKRLIIENPFADLKGTTVKADREKFHFVKRADADAVLAACPDAEWKLIFALSRYGGLRCPSEHLGLTWGDIDWERGRMTVRSPKTEHHEGKASRIVPLFPELRSYLDAAWEQAEPGAVHVVTRYRDAKQNLRTQLLRIISRAGVKPWPKLFQNLRSTRETELAESFPIHVVCEWIGNSQAVAREHYLQITEAHLDRACSVVTGALHKATQQPSESGSNVSLRKKQPIEIPVDNDGLQCMTTDRIPPRGVEPLFPP